MPSQTLWKLQMYGGETITMHFHSFVMTLLQYHNVYKFSKSQLNRPRPRGGLKFFVQLLPKITFENHMTKTIQNVQHDVWSSSG